MGWAGLMLLVLALVLMMSTGWPTYAVLLGVCVLGAVGGIAAGAFDAAVLGSLPGRIIGLLEHDLLQALALYALVGALFDRLALADSLYGGLRQALLPWAPRAAPELAGLTLGALMAPINGAVGASVMALSRSAGTVWRADGVPAVRRTALVALASTLGVIVPPSLVLLLLGDAMLRAHTEGLNLARDHALPLAQAGLRIVNTQDVMQAVLLPGALLLLGWLAISALSPIRARATAGLGRPWRRAECWALLIVALVIAALLVLVASGRVRPVEAAASAAVLLLAWGAASRRLTRSVLAQVLDDALALTGALFALLLAATSVSLLMRAFGTDRLVSDLMLGMQGHPLVATAVVLALMLASAFVLDAFELIFLVIPIVMPPLLAQVGDAAWVAAMTMLVLQAGFLLPPLGYAVVLAQAQSAQRAALIDVARALLPYLVWLALLIGAVFAWPEVTQWLRSAPQSAGQEQTFDPEQVERLLREMSKPSR